MFTDCPASIYRFHNQVALSFPGGTVYLSPGNADRLAYALKKAIADIDRLPFSKSSFPSEVCFLVGVKE